MKLSVSQMSGNAQCSTGFAASSRASHSGCALRRVGVDRVRVDASHHAHAQPPGSFDDLTEDVAVAQVELR